jgi:hypothetical protein
MTPHTLQRDLGIKYGSDESTKNCGDQLNEDNILNDVSGECIVPCAHVVCVVVDEAHRATGL